MFERRVPRPPKVDGSILFDQSKLEAYREIAGAFFEAGHELIFRPAEQDKLGLLKRLHNKGKLLYELHGSPKAVEAFHAAMEELEFFGEKVAEAKEKMGIVNDALLITRHGLTLANAIRKGHVLSALSSRRFIE